MRKAESERLKKQIRNLRQRLQTVLPIQGNPIRYERTSDRYDCVFSIHAEGAAGVSVPFGTSWSDIRITDIGGGRIEFAVKGKEVFASSRTSADGRRQREAAERATTSARELPLEAMGLAKPNGQANDEGRGLLAMLHSGGRVARKADDFAVLRLAKRLREWTEIDADPFRYLEGEGDRHPNHVFRFRQVCQRSGIDPARNALKLFTNLPMERRREIWAALRHYAKRHLPRSWQACQGQAVLGRRPKGRRYL